MKITFDPAKREKTLRERLIDFGDAEQVFDGPTWTFQDRRFDYPEDRFIIVGLLSHRMVMVVWTPTADDEVRHVISMRKANAREQTRYRDRLNQA
jgi:uncharacterized protein